MKRTPEQHAEIAELPKYWVKVQAQTTKAQKYNYHKLVSHTVAHRLVHGVPDGLGGRTKTTTLDYKILT